MRVPPDMVSIGYFLSCEEFGPRELVRQARLAQAAGFERLWISDHFHPWTGAQGHSPFVWSVIGALSEAVMLPVTTAVTCPTVRIHPAIIAQAAATAAVQLNGRFVLGVGSGEALNEHILGDVWPPVGVRLAMLEEAVELIRLLHRGDEVSFHGEHYEVYDARIYTLPDQPVPIYVSGLGTQATALAGRIGDGYCTTMPDADLVRVFREAGDPKRPVQGAEGVLGRDRAGRRGDRAPAVGQRAAAGPARPDLAAAKGL
jgi:G6PDH family F420-dependent oxidoreductase